MNTLGGAAKLLLSSPSWWRYALIPVLVLVGLTVGGVATVTIWGAPRVFHLVATSETAAWYQTLGGATLALLATVAGAMVAFVGAWVLTPVLCSPLFERLVQRVEETLGVAPHRSLAFIPSMLCGFRAQVTGLALLVPVWLVLWMLNWAAPFLSPILVPLRMLAISSSLAWNLLDYPLTLRGVTIRGRLAFVRRHVRPVLGFGLAFSLLFWLPLAAVVLLPFGVVGATQLVWRIARTDAEWEARLMGLE